MDYSRAGMTEFLKLLGGSLIGLFRSRAARCVGVDHINSPNLLLPFGTVSPKSVFRLRIALPSLSEAVAESALFNSSRDGVVFHACAAVTLYRGWHNVGRAAGQLLEFALRGGNVQSK
jgi:hypothetical protein